MLVLNRKVDERIRIADAIEVVVLEVRGSRVRLGIQCPREVPVHRTELLMDEEPAASDALALWSV